MRSRFLFIMMFLGGLFCSYAQDSTRVLLIALDGICTEGLEKASTPNLDKLMLEGAYSYNTRNVIPSVTLPNWTSLLCGSGPERHGVINNSWTTKNVQLKAVVSNENGYYPSIFQVLKEQLPNVKTAYYYNWAQLINAFDAQYLDEKIYLSNDEFVPNYEKAFEFMQVNRHVPTLVFLYDVHTDHVGHNYGWMSDPYIKAIEEADEQVGKLIKKMKDAQLYEDTYIFFITDHGGIGTGHGGYTQEEMSIPWSITGKDVKTGLIKEQNFTVNTASMIAHLFDVEQPNFWAGNVLTSVFARSNPSIIPSDNLENAVYYRIQNETIGKYLAADQSGKICLSEKNETDNIYWALIKSGNGYLLTNKAFSDKALGEEQNEISLIDKNKGSVWYLCMDPKEKGLYSISQSSDASQKCLQGSIDNSVSYWIPAAFSQDGLFWILFSEDSRTQIDEKRQLLKEEIDVALSNKKLMESKMSNQIIGSCTQSAVDYLRASIEKAQKDLDNISLTVEEIEASITSLSRSIDEAWNMPKLDFVEGATYQIQNADPRFNGLVYLYVDKNNVVRWGVEKKEIANNFLWKVTKKNDHYVLYNIGTEKYLGSCAWDTSRPEQVIVEEQEMEYELNNSLVVNEPRDWAMRSVDSYDAQNPEKSFIACTDDNSSNLTDGRIRPWDPNDAMANHDAFWRFVIQESSIRQQK